jgi:transcriptional regulator with XRE-family HTH domain
MEGRFGAIIAQARSDRRITLRDLGKMLDVAPSLLSEIEHGRRKPPAKSDILDKLARVLGLDAQQLRDLAARERTAWGAGFLEKALGKHQNLAFGLYRAGEHASEDDWARAIQKAIKELGGEVNDQ